MTDLDASSIDPGTETSPGARCAAALRSSVTRGASEIPALSCHLPICIHERPLSLRLRAGPASRHSDDWTCAGPRGGSSAAGSDDQFGLAAFFWIGDESTHPKRLAPYPSSLVDVSAASMASRSLTTIMAPTMRRLSPSRRVHERTIGVCPSQPKWSIKAEPMS